jgi:hypothetical protein
LFALADTESALHLFASDNVFDVEVGDVEQKIATFGFTSQQHMLIFRIISILLPNEVK